MKTLASFSEWIQVLKQPTTGSLAPWFAVNYGHDLDRIQERSRKFGHLLGLAKGHGCFDPGRELMLGRTPCRARVFGGHTDFKGCGGYLINLAGNLEMMYAGQTRPDRRVCLGNANPDLASCEFELDDWDVCPEVVIDTAEEWDAWCTKIEERKKQHVRNGLSGVDHEGQFLEAWTRYRESNWQEFVKGILAFLQTHLGDPTGEIRKKLNGFNAYIWSEVPMGWGLSSSSALVMSMGNLVNTLFGLGLSDDDVVKLGYCEHYNGTKGGMNDHASIVKGVAGKILLMRSFPEEIVETTPFPAGVSLFLADSGTKRSEAPQVSAKFQREEISDAAVILARTGIGYVLGSLWIRHCFPEYKTELTPDPEKNNDDNGLLREFNRLGKIQFVDAHERAKAIYRVLAAIPERVTREQLLTAMPEFHEKLKVIFVTHPEPAGGYALRGMVLYGLAENERSFEYMRRAGAGDLTGLLELMRIAQDGDRVAKFRFTHDPYGVESAFEFKASDTDLSFWERLPRKNPVWQKPGYFERSIEPVDRLCDLIEQRFGDTAAGRIAAAGLGGAVTVLAKSESVEEIRTFLKQKGYASTEPFVPSAGASIIRWSGSK
jgi:galactokinase